MIAAEIDARPYAHGPLGGFESPGKLLRLRMWNSVAFQITPRARDRAEPIFHLRDNEAAELLFRQLLHAEDAEQEVFYLRHATGREALKVFQRSGVSRQQQQRPRTGLITLCQNYEESCRRVREGVFRVVS